MAQRAWGWLVLVAVWVGSCIRAGAEREAEMGSGIDAARGELVLDAKTNCGSIPLKLRGYVALECSSTRAIKECMGLGQSDPGYYGRNCTGDYCILRPEGPSACILRNTGISVDPSNETRSESCGLDPAYAATLTLHQMPHTTNGNCLVGLPKDVGFYFEYICENGKLQNCLKVTFPKAIEEPFTCIYNPTCIEGTYQSNLICYLSGPEHHAMETNSSQKTSHVLVYLLIISVLLLWVQK